MAISGTESDSDSPEHAASGSAPPPLSAIAERRRSGEDSEDDEEDTGAWRTADVPRTAGETDIRAGYLWKKGERRKVRSICGFPKLKKHDWGAAHTDLETAVVRATLGAPRVLQDLGRIPAPQPA